jgi:ferredoxin
MPRREPAAPPADARAAAGLAMKQRLRVDPIACKAHGVCAELFPERIRLDDWGYPILDPRTITDDLIDHARRAGARVRPDDPPDDVALRRAQTT